MTTRIDNDQWEDALDEVGVALSQLLETIDALATLPTPTAEDGARLTSLAAAIDSLQQQLYNNYKTFINHQWRQERKAEVRRTRHGG